MGLGVTAVMLEIPGAMMKGRDRSIPYPTQRSAQKIDGLDTDLCRLAIEFWQWRVQSSGFGVQHSALPPRLKLTMGFNQLSLQAAPY